MKWLGVTLVGVMGCVSVLSQAQRSLAATYTWTGAGADSNWSTPENWLGDAPSAPGSLTDILHFWSESSASINQDIGDYTLNSLVFDRDTSLITLRASNGSLVFDGQSPTIVQDSSAASIIDGSYAGTRAIQLSVDTTVTGTGAGNLYIHGQLTGPGALIVALESDGYLSLRYSDNDYSGGTILRGGVLRISSDDNLGAPSGGLIFDGGTLQTEAAFISSRAIVLNDQAAELYMWSDLTLTGDVSGSGGLIKTGSGVLTLSGNNTYTGATTISQGTLRLGTPDALPGSTALTIATPALLDLNGFDYTASAIGGDGTVALYGATLTIDTDDKTSVSVKMVGSGGLTKTGNGELVLNQVCNYKGPTEVMQGQLTITKQNNSPSFTANAGCILRIEGDALLGAIRPTRVLRSHVGGVIEYRNATIGSGYLRGPGIHRTLSESATHFIGVTAYGSAELQVDGPTILTNFTNGGQITSLDSHRGELA